MTLRLGMLQSFCYVETGPSTKYPHHSINPADLVKALESVSATLETVELARGPSWINFVPGGRAFKHSDNWRAALYNVAQFPKIKRITLDRVFTLHAFLGFRQPPTPFRDLDTVLPRPTGTWKLKEIVVVVADTSYALRALYHFDLITSLQTMIFILYHKMAIVVNGRMGPLCIDIDEIKRAAGGLEVQWEGMSVKVSRKLVA